MDWRHHAACRDVDPELFFPIGNTGPALLQIDEAKQVCQGCKVMDLACSGRSRVARTPVSGADLARMSGAQSSAAAGSPREREPSRRRSCAASRAGGAAQLRSVTRLLVVRSGAHVGEPIESRPVVMPG